MKDGHVSLPLSWSRRWFTVTVLLVFVTVMIYGNVAHSVGKEPPCHSGWVLFRNNTCVRVFTKKSMPREVAQEQCKQFGGSLVMLPRDPTLSNLLMEGMTKKELAQQYWIGKAPESDTMCWALLFDVENTYKFSSTPCNESLNFICHRRTDGLCQQNTTGCSCDGNDPESCKCDKWFISLGSICVDDWNCDDNATGCLCMLDENNHQECKCQHGYRPYHNMCLDVNECEDEDNRKACHQVCVNTDGSMRCDCDKGFVLDANKRDCKNTTAEQGKGAACCEHLHNPFLVFLPMVYRTLSWLFRGALHC